ncbi:hypothetical protein PTKIN_Ptkin02bG0240000 [Pterospermum kingtungense]
MEEDISIDLSQSGSEIESSVSSPSSKRYSRVWEDFILEVGHSPTKRPKAKCKHCGQTYSAVSRLGTSNLQRHLLKCSKRPKDTHVQVDQHAYRELLAKAIIRHGYTFTWVEHEGNREVHAFLNKSVETISRNTIKGDCLKLHKKLKEKLKSDLKGLSSRICLTSDMWTSCTSRGFLCLTAHFIDDNWNLQSKILNFCHVPPPHKAINFCQTIHTLLRDWGIE